MQKRAYCDKHDDGSLGCERQPRVNVSEHTPTPWEIQNHEDSLYIGPAIIEGNDSEDLANAAFIVKCVNSHEELVSKLKTFRAILIAKGDQAAYVAELEALLAKAESVTNVPSSEGK